jgi:hypothetical protein
MRVLIGYDPREDSAYKVAADSLERTSGLTAEPLNETTLRIRGLLWRPVDRRGRMHDIVSNADQSTEFAISRFLVPILCTGGWALFTDADVVFLRDVKEMLLEVDKDPGKAVYVVKHDHRPAEPWKMDGQTQLHYTRKNWSSVCLWQVDHPANQRLSLHDVNTRPGRWLHAFAWLADSEIGALSPEWNWLVGSTPKPENPAIAHFTSGGPWFENWHGAEHDEIWTKAKADLHTTKGTA